MDEKLKATNYRECSGTFPDCCLTCESYHAGWDTMCEGPMCDTHGGEEIEDYYICDDFKRGKSWQA